MFRSTRSLFTTLATLSIAASLPAVRAHIFRRQASAPQWTPGVFVDDGDDDGGIPVIFDENGNLPGSGSGPGPRPDTSKTTTDTATTTGTAAAASTTAPASQSQPPPAPAPSPTSTNRGGGGTRPKPVELGGACDGNSSSSSCASGLTCRAAQPPATGRTCQSGSAPPKSVTPPTPSQPTTSSTTTLASNGTSTSASLPSSTSSTSSLLPAVPPPPDATHDAKFSAAISFGPAISCAIISTISVMMTTMLL
ncbi:hypothetical protein BASA61_002706 [Batrachochytrium salamandrivorans]|nr:hypothetical protein BASA61_002706 [Batrachochytrium salamandrivorans]KAH9248739.1 hypothetical protein BASA81_013580 [Batrachochytrium salamandrivorans]